MSDNDLTTSDVLIDKTKDFRNIYLDQEDEEEHVPLSDSLYFTETEFNNILTQRYTSNDNLTIISLNIANLLSKLNSLKTFLHYISSTRTKPDIIIVVETHITEENTVYTGKELRELLPNYHFYHKGRTHKKGGGVGIFVSKNLSGGAHLNPDSQEKVRFIEEAFENIVITIPDAIATSNGSIKKNLVLAAVYRQPNRDNFEQFENQLKKLLQVIDKKKNELVIAGDFNLDLLKYETHAPTASYLDSLTERRLLPRIVRPTRIKKQSATLIDHIFTKENGNTVFSGIIDTEIAGNNGYTDHLPTFVILKTMVPKKTHQKFYTVSYFTNDGHKKRRAGLINQDWDQLYQCDDPNIIYNDLQVLYGSHYENSKTTKTIKSGSYRHKKEPWMTDELLVLMKKRDRLAKVKDKRQEYKKTRNEIVSKARKARKQHLHDQIKRSMGDTKKHWKIVKEAINKTNDKTETTTKFYYQGKWTNDPQENADNCNEYLATIGKETNENVGKPKRQATDYLRKHSERNQYSLLFSDVTSDDVVDACNKFTRKTSADGAGFKQNIVLQDIDILAPILAHLINCSQRTGIFPENAKLAKVIPVYKNKGDKHTFGNYRPVALLPIFSKIMERLIYNKVFDFLVRYEILFESQYGFRSGHNTTHATLDFVNVIEDAIEANNYAIGVFCDLSKAFDTLNHEILLTKLEHYGIRNKEWKWFQSYLNGRFQYVELNGYQSTKANLETGVPQGSVLGPLLFLLYINDLPSSTKLKSIIFADDTNLLISGNDLAELVSTLNEELKSVSDFFKANQLKLNAKKTKIVCFRKKAPPAALEDQAVLLDGEQLRFEEEAVFLGITLDSNLTWEKHCINVANKISRNNSLINRVKNLLPPSSLKLLYNSFIQPHIQYGQAVWGGCSNQNKQRIITIQKRAIRTVSKALHKAHTEPRMKKMQLLNFDDLYKQQCVLLCYDCTMKRAPQQISSSLITEQTTHTTRSQTNNPLNMKIPTFKSRAGCQSFRAKGPTIWNVLPNEIKSIDKRERFKGAVKRFFLHNYARKSDCTNPRCTDHNFH